TLATSAVRARSAAACAASRAAPPPRIPGLLAAARSSATSPTASQSNPPLIGVMIVSRRRGAWVDARARVVPAVATGPAVLAGWRRPVPLPAWHWGMVARAGAAPAATPLATAPE